MQLKVLSTNTKNYHSKKVALFFFVLHVKFHQCCLQKEPISKKHIKKYEIINVNRIEKCKVNKKLREKLFLVDSHVLGSPETRLVNIIYLFL